MIQSLLCLCCEPLCSPVQTPKGKAVALGINLGADFRQCFSLSRETQSCGAHLAFWINLPTYSLPFLWNKISHSNIDNQYWHWALQPWRYSVWLFYIMGFVWKEKNPTMNWLYRGSCDIVVCPPAIWPLVLMVFTQRCRRTWALLVNVMQDDAHPNEAQPTRDDEPTLVWHPVQPHQIFYLRTVMALLSQGVSINKYTVTQTIRTHTHTCIH